MTFGALKYMSVEVMTWVLEDAPDFPPHLLGVLMGLANKADKDGRGAWPGQATLAQWAKKTDRAARNDLTQLEELGLIRRGDQSLVSHIVGDERPVVWDIAMERTRERERNHASGPKDRKHSSGRKPTSGPSGTEDAGQETSPGSAVPGGSPLPGEGTGSVVQKDRKHTSADTSGDTPRGSLPTGENTPTREDGDLGESKADLSPELAEAIDRVCIHLADRIADNGSKRPSIGKTWRDAARLLMTRDERTEQQIHAAIDWCQDNEFWRRTVMSMPKLRDHYDRMRLEATSRRGARASPSKGHGDSGPYLPEQDYTNVRL
jgi:hypothetical protein